MSSNRTSLSLETASIGFLMATVLSASSQQSNLDGKLFFEKFILVILIFVGMKTKKVHFAQMHYFTVHDRFTSFFVYYLRHFKWYDHALSEAQTKLIILLKIN